MLEGRKSRALLELLVLIGTLLSVIAAQSTGNVCKKEDSTQRIVGGVPAPRCRFPYMVSIRGLNRLHKCGGSLIHPRWVLTAAHCVDPRDPRSAGTNPTVHIGSLLLGDAGGSNGVEVMLSEDVIVHPLYTGEALSPFDIALVRLPKDSALTPVTLPSPKFVASPGIIPVVLGWGETGRAPVQELQMADLVIVGFDRCKEVWGNNLKDHMTCALSRVADSCRGDSGGPLVLPDDPLDGGGLASGNPSLDLLVGIVSFGDADCEKLEKPGVYTSVAYFTEWIRTTMAGYKLAPPPTTTAPSPSPPKAPQIDPSKTDNLELLQLQLNQELFDAIAGGDVRKTQRLLDTGASLTFQDINKFTPLHAAVDNDRIKLVKFLIDAGAELDVRNIGGDTPLVLAVIAQFLDIVEVLLKAGSDTEIKEINGATALSIAVDLDDLEIFELLLEYGADVNTKDDNGWTPLHFVALTGAADIAKILVDAGADLEARTGNGLTPLMVAVMYGSIDAAKVFIDSGADVNAKDDIEGISALAFAAEFGWAEVVKLLLDSGADKDAVDGLGKTAFDFIPKDSPDKAALKKLLG